MEVEHRLAELPAVGDERGVGPRERRVRARLAGLLAARAGRRGGSGWRGRAAPRRAPCARAARPRARRSAGASGRRRAATRASVRRSSRSESRTQATPDPGEVSGLGDDESRHGGLRRAGCARSPGARTPPSSATTASGRERGPEAERDGDGDQEEREPGVGVRAAGEHREHADRDDVDRRRDDGEPLARTPDVDVGEDPGAPRGEERERRRGTSLAARSGPMLSPSAISAIAGRRSHATTRSASAVASPDVAGNVGRSTARPTRSGPRRIALATAAARSETPSFSYRCWTCVLTVVRPR